MENKPTSQQMFPLIPQSIPDRPFGWTPHPQESLLLEKMRDLIALGLDAKSIAASLNVRAPGSWTPNKVESALGFLQGPGGQFVFRSLGPGPKAEANDPDFICSFLETENLGQIIFKHHKHKDTSFFCCQSDDWVLREVLRDGQIQDLKIPVEIQLWVWTCMAISKSTPSVVLAGKLEGFLRKANFKKP